jgi:hypothetical protein
MLSSKVKTTNLSSIENSFDLNDRSASFERADLHKLCKQKEADLTKRFTGIEKELERTIENCR